MRETVRRRSRKMSSSQDARFAINTPTSEYTPIVFAKETPYRTKVTVIQEDAKDEYPVPTLEDRNDSKEAEVEKSLYLPKKEVEKEFSDISDPLEPIPNVDRKSGDPLLDYEIVLESSQVSESRHGASQRSESRNPTHPTDEDVESSIFDNLSAFTIPELQVEAREGMETMLRNFFESPREAFDTVFDTIMENTDFTSTPLTGNLLADTSLGPSCDATNLKCELHSSNDIYEMCEALKGELYLECDKIQQYLDDSAPYDERDELQLKSKDESSIAKEDTFIDFGALSHQETPDQYVAPKKENEPSGFMSIFADGGCFLSSTYDTFYPSDEECNPVICPEDEDEDKIVRCKIEEIVKHINVGIGLTNSTDGKDILISGIDPRSKFVSTDLKVGMKVLKINGQRCPASVAKAFTLMRETGDSLEIIALRTAESEAAPEVSAALCGPSSDEHSRSLHSFGDSIWVPVINEDGLCTTDVTENQMTTKDKVLEKKEKGKSGEGFFKGLFGGVFKWNKTKEPVEEAAKETAKSATPKRVTFDDTVKNGSGSAHRGMGANTQNNRKKTTQKKKQMTQSRTFKIQRESWAEPIGLKLAKGKGGVIVSEIKEDSPFRFTGLQVGMRLMEINGVPCPKSLLVATNLMRAAEGDVQLIATQEEEENEEEVPLLFYSTY